MEGTRDRKTREEVTSKLYKRHGSLLNNSDYRGKRWDGFKGDIQEEDNVETGDDCNGE